MDLNKLTIFQAQELLRAKKTSSLELVDFFLKRIRDLDPKLKTCLSVFESEAREQAIIADQRRLDGETGDLLGIPYLAKDNILFKGKKATGASKMLENYIAPYNARVIEILEKEGAILLGKLNLDELGQGSSSENSVFFPSHNAWDLNRVPGDASASAVSAGLALFAIGSDSGGSSRQAASFSNISGLKPSYGLVSRWGLMSLSSSTDTIGILAKTASETALLLKHLAGVDERDLNTAAAKKLDYLNGYYLRQKTDEQLFELFKKFLPLANDEQIKILPGMNNIFVNSLSINNQRYN